MCLTFWQWVNLFPEIKDHLINIFERYTHVLDAELQQRACEYLALARRDDEGDLLATMCDEMPVFPERESTLINRLHSRGDAAQDKRTWIIGHSGDNKEREAERFKAFRKPTGDSTNGSPIVTQPPQQPMAESSRSASQSVSPPVTAPLPEPQRSRTASVGADAMMGMSTGPADDIMASLAGLDMSGGNNIQEQPLLSSSLPKSISEVPPMMSPPVPAPASNGSNGVESNGLEDAGLKYQATLGGVAPSLLAPLTAAPNIEKVS